MDNFEANRPEQKIKFIKSAAEIDEMDSATDKDTSAELQIPFYESVLFGEALRRQMDSDAKETAEQDKKAKEEREKEKLIEEIKNLKQNRKIKKNFSKQVINYLWWFSLSCLVIIFLEGFSPKIYLYINLNYFHFNFKLNGFHIDDVPLTTLIGSTAVSAIGLVAIVLQGLFKVPKDEKDVEHTEKK